MISTQRGSTVDARNLRTSSPRNAGTSTTWTDTSGPPWPILRRWRRSARMRDLPTRARPEAQLPDRTDEEAVQLHRHRRRRRALEPSNRPPTLPNLRRNSS